LIKDADGTFGDRSATDADPSADLADEELGEEVQREESKKRYYRINIL
jgi:hypothetical protein